jgi:hypothetical protein
MTCYANAGSRTSYEIETAMFIYQMACSAMRLSLMSRYSLCPRKSVVALFQDGFYEWRFT